MWGNDPVGVGGEGGGRIDLRTKEIEVDCIHCKGTGGQDNRKACATRQEWNTP